MHGYHAYSMIRHTPDVTYQYKPERTNLSSLHTHGSTLRPTPRTQFLRHEHPKPKSALTLCRSAMITLERRDAEPRKVPGFGVNRSGTVLAMIILNSCNICN